MCIQYELISTETDVGIPRKACEIVKGFCKTCNTAQKAKEEAKVKAASAQRLDPEPVWNRLQADLIDMRKHPSKDKRLNRTCSWLLHVKDHGGKLSLLVGIEAKSCAAVAQELLHWFRLFGPPKVLHTDNGKEFVGKEIIRIIQASWNDIRLVQGRPRTPRTQGLVERGNSVIKKMLRCLLLEKNLPLNEWTNVLDELMLKMNAALNRGVNDNAFNLNFGRRPHFELYAGASSNIPQDVVLKEVDLNEELIKSLGIVAEPPVDEDIQPDGDALEEDGWGSQRTDDEPWVEESLMLALVEEPKASNTNINKRTRRRK